MTCIDHLEFTGLKCPNCNDEVDEYGNTENQFEYCSFPDCGCQGSRNCAARTPHTYNLETGEGNMKDSTRDMLISKFHFKWVNLHTEDIINNRYYAVRDELNVKSTAAIALAYTDITGNWWIKFKVPVPFSVAYVCNIGGLTETFINGPFAIGNEVELLEPVDDYSRHSIGVIVGKYDIMRTWCVRMKDNFVILVKDDKFKNTSKGTVNAIHS